MLSYWLHLLQVCQQKVRSAVFTKTRERFLYFNEIFSNNFKLIYNFSILDVKKLISEEDISATDRIFPFLISAYPITLCLMIVIRFVSLMIKD